MDIKNHNTDKKKLVNRKQFKAAVVIAVFLGIVLTVSRYFKFVSKTVYEESDRQESDLSSYVGRESAEHLQ